MELLKKFQIGPDRQCSTLERISLGIKYIELGTKLTNAKDGITSWKKHLRKERQKKNRYLHE